MRLIKIQYAESHLELFDNYEEMVLQMVEPDILMLSRQNNIQGLDKDDIAQELRFELWKRVLKYNPALSGLRTWGIKVLRNKLKNLYRDSLRHKRCIQYHSERLIDED